jgi:hypothetical protein
MAKLVTEADTVLTSNQTVDGIHIKEGATLELDPRETIVVESKGNVIVEGILRMRPRNAATVHTLRISGANEADFVGGHTEVPLESDRGIWVMGNGQLDLEGSSSTAWTRDPKCALGWEAADELVITPTAPGDFTGFESYTPGDEVPIGPAGLPAEVFNLTHNVILEGEETGRSHVFIHSNVPQYLRYVAVRHMGPRQQVTGENYTEGVLSRYPVHFHICGDGSRGSRIEGVVVHHSGNRAFVPHASHGVVFRNCVAYDVWEDAYWWDPPSPEPGGPTNESHDVVWKNCLAALVQDDPPYRGFRLSAFFLGRGNRNKCIGCVAAGVQGGKNASGFIWPESGSVWQFRHCVAHNNKFNGIFVWQNTRTIHPIEDFTSYSCGKAGVEHGAYGNPYHFERLNLVCNRIGIMLHALSNQSDQMRWEQILVTGSLPSLQSVKHNLPGRSPVLFRDSKFPEGIAIDDGDGHPSVLDFVRCGLEPEDIEVSKAHDDAVVRVQRENGTAFQILGTGEVSDIPPFD